LGDRWGEKQSVVIPEINIIAIKDAKKKTVIVRLLGKERNMKQFKKEQVSGGGVAGVFNRIIDFIL